MKRMHHGEWVGAAVWGLIGGVVAAGCQSGGERAAVPGSLAWVAPVVARGTGESPATSGAVRVGDGAPPLHADTWVQGKSVSAFTRFRVYAIAFWSPSSGPSVEALPHLSRVQRDNEDVVVIGAVATERPPEDAGADQRLSELQKFVAARGEDVGFRVAFDGGRVMRDTWLLAAGQTGIPCVFLVGRDGKIAWIGHPDDMDEPLADALRAGRGWVWSQD